MSLQIPHKTSCLSCYHYIFISGPHLAYVFIEIIVLGPTLEFHLPVDKTQTA